MSEDYLYDASLVGEETWLDFWRLNGEARITIERPSLSGGDKAKLDSPVNTPTVLRGIKTIVFDVEMKDIETGAGKLVIGDRKFETLDEIKYGDVIIFGDETCDVVRIDTINIGDLRVFSAKAHRIK